MTIKNRGSQVHRDRTKYHRPSMENPFDDMNLDSELTVVLKLPFDKKTWPKFKHSQDLKIAEYVVQLYEDDNLKFTVWED